MEKKTLVLFLIALSVTIPPGLGAGASNDTAVALPPADQPDGELSRSEDPVTNRSGGPDTDTSSPENASIRGDTIALGRINLTTLAERLQGHNATPALPHAAPPGLGIQDPWVDANGDEMFGDLDMGRNAVVLNGRLLSATTSGALQFDGDTVCFETSTTCSKASMNGEYPIDVDGETIRLVNLGCQAGDIWKWTGSSWDCSPDMDTDTDTTYDGTDFTLSNQACATGEVVAGVDASGNIACVIDQDSDVDTLSSLSCTTDQVAKWNGTAWSCAEDIDTDTDTTYDGTDFTLSGQACATGDVVAGVSPEGLVVCVEDQDTTTETTSLPWANVTDKPADFADGVDNDTQYDGTDFTLSDQACASGEVVAAVDANGNIACIVDQDSDTDTLSTLSCTTDQVAKFDGSSWTCAEDVDTDTDTTYTAGFGLDLSDTELSANTSEVQERIFQACPRGRVIRAIHAGGTVTCEIDQDTTYNGTDFTLSDQACASGEVVAGVSPEGLVVCVADQDTTTETTSLPWTNLTNVPAGFADGTDDVGITSEADPTVNALGKASLACTSGQLAKFDGTSWTCSEDIDNDTQYDGTDFALANQACATGEVVAGVDANGNIACIIDQDSDTDTLSTLSCTTDQVAKWNGTAWSCAEDIDTDTDTTYDGTDFALSSQACATGEVAAGLTAEGLLVCVTDQDTDTTYTAGTGLILEDTEFKADASVLQARLLSECAPGSAIRAVDADGVVTCETDDVLSTLDWANITDKPTGFADDVDDDTLASLPCNAGQIAKIPSGGGTGSAWSCAADAFDPNTDTLATLSCASNELAKWDGAAWVCSTDQVGITSESDPTVNDLGKASLACASGQLAKFDGTSWTCGNDIDTDTDTTYDGTDFTLSNQACATGEQVVGVTTDGLVTCATDATGGDGDTLGALSCTSDEITRYEGTAWICSTDQVGLTSETDPTVNDLGKASLGCTSGQLAKFDGTNWTCSDDIDTDTDTTYDGTDFALSDQACASGEVVAGVDASGDVACVADQDTDTDTLGSLSCAGDDITRFDGSGWVCSTD